MYVGMKARPKTFTKEFMSQFKEEHAQAFPGSEPQTGGAPDAGDGRYSDKLDYKHWLEFNNANRTHMNFVENLPLILGTLAIGGLILPRVTMWIAIVNTISRILYTVMYINWGSNNRKLGAVAGGVPIMLVLIWTVYELGNMAIAKM